MPKTLLTMRHLVDLKSLSEYVDIQSKVEKGFDNAREAQKIRKWMERILF